MSTHTVNSLAARIKAKYPDYANIDDVQLVSKVTQKHPEYMSVLTPTDAQQINAARQPGAYQTKPGAGIENANTPEGGATPSSVSREGALGFSSGFTGAPESQTPLADMWKSATTQKPSMAETLDPTGGALSNAAQMVKNLFSSGKELVGSVGTPTTERGIIDSNQAAHAIGSMGGQAMQLGALKGAGEAVTDPVGAGLKTMGQEVMNEGPSKLRVLEDNHAHATAAQKHVADIATKVHDDAQAAMANVAQKIDGPTPEGIFDKKDLSNRIADAIGDTAEPSTLPKSIRDLLPGDGLDSMRKSTGPAVGGRHFDLSNPNDLKAFQKMRDQGVFSDEELARMEGTKGGDNAHTFGELQQIRSKVGKDIQNLHGPASAAGSAVYKELSTMLREGARNAGVEPDWVDANARWKGYMDDFHRSPLKKTLEGDNAHDIMGPLASDATRIQVRNILAKYQPFGADIPTLDQEVGRWNLANKIDRLGQPSKWTVLGAMVSPKAAAMKTMASKALRNPKVTGAIAGKGFDAPTIKPKQVYPTKEAAMRAMKEKD